MLLLSSGASALTTDPIQLALLVPSVMLAWLTTFGLMFAIGCAGFWFTQMMGLFNFYFGVDNLFDKKPPLGLLGTAGGDPYDTVGRYFYAGAQVEF